MKLVASSALETRAIGAAFGSVLAGGDVVLLVGDLGAGKTTFAQGIAVGLGVTEPVTSPTFTIVQEYDGRVPVAHVDVYRLERLQELIDVGLEELVDGGRVTLVEWGDQVAQVLPPDHVTVTLEPGASDDERLLSFDPRGGRWRARRAELERVLRKWSDAQGDD